MILSNMVGDSHSKIKGRHMKAFKEFFNESFGKLDLKGEVSYWCLFVFIEVMMITACKVRVYYPDAKVITSEDIQMNARDGNYYNWQFGVIKEKSPLYKSISSENLGYIYPTEEVIFAMDDENYSIVIYGPELYLTPTKNILWVGPYDYLEKKTQGELIQEILNPY